VVAGMDGEAATALTGERLLDLLLARGFGSENASRQQYREEQQEHARGMAAGTPLAAAGPFGAAGAIGRADSWAARAHSAGARASPRV